MVDTLVNERIVEKIWSKRLAYCHATVTAYGRNDDPSVFLLKSYNTTVACVIVNTGCVYGVDMLRHEYGYTATSAQHIAKFFNHYVDYVARTKNKETLKLRYYA